MNELLLTIAVMAAGTVIMGRICYWVDGTAFINNAARAMMDHIPWDYGEIKSSLIGIWYYLAPMIFIAAFCLVFRFNIFKYIMISPEYLAYIPLTILAEFSVTTMLSGVLTLFSEKVDWKNDIGDITWIQSIHQHNKLVAPLVPLLGAFVEEWFYRGIVFLILYLYFPQAGFIGAALVSGILFSIDQILFTDKKSQAFSMVIASLGITLVACTSIVITNSFLPCLIAHECFLIMYSGMFMYY